jgi:hypothetical protein
MIKCTCTDKILVVPKTDHAAVAVSKHSDDTIDSVNKDRNITVILPY